MQLHIFSVVKRHRTKKGDLYALFDTIETFHIYGRNFNWTFQLKFSTLNFWYSTSTDLTFGDLYNHFWKIQHFCLYIPEGIN